MCIGGNVNSTGRTNSTDKINRITSPHYTNAEEPVALISSYNVSGSNAIQYGGGSSLTNAVTQHTFHTAANTTTTNGTERLRIDSSGRVLIGTNTVSPASVYNNDLIIYENGQCGISVRGSDSNSSYATLSLGDTTTASRSYLEAQLGTNGVFTIGKVGTGNMRFLNNGAERATINSSGDLALKTGNLVISTAGKGIDFSAQTTTPQGGASSDDELFNHYEEGDWTPEPVITYQGGTGALSAIQDQYGRYVRSGRYVQVWFYVKFTAANITNCNVGLNGLPFTISNDAQWNSGFNGGIARRGVTGGETYVCEGMGKNGTQISVLRKYNNYGFTDTTQSIGGEACYLVD